MKQVEARFAKSKYTQVSELGSRFNLSFTSQLVFGNKIIALDGVKRSLLVFETNKELNQAYVIELNKVAAITLKKIYGSIRPGELQKKRMEEFLKKIDLQFEYKGKNETIVLPFYDSETDDRRYLPKLERNAKNWQMILSKMTGS
jgi:hypothetical protein